MCGSGFVDYSHQMNFGTPLLGVYLVLVTSLTDHWWNPALGPISVAREWASTPHTIVLSSPRTSSGLGALNWVV